jgi:hypothetical protein
MAHVKIRATRTGYDGIKLRQPGDLFDWPADQKIPRWAQRADEPFVETSADADAQSLERRDQIAGMIGQSTPEPRTYAEAQTRGRGRPRGG